MKMTESIKPLDRALVEDAVAKLRQHADTRIAEMNEDLKDLRKLCRSLVSVQQRQLDLFSSQVNHDIQALELILRD